MCFPREEDATQLESKESLKGAAVAEDAAVAVEEAIVLDGNTAEGDDVDANADGDTALSAASPARLTPETHIALNL